MRFETELGSTLTIRTMRPVSMTSEGGWTTVVIGVANGEQEPEAEVPQSSRATGPRCGVMMVRSGQPCARREGHNGVHMNAQQVARKQGYNKKRARERYQNDPDYAEKVRAQVRRSAKKEGDKATA